MPRISACAAIPAGWTAGSQTRLRRRLPCWRALNRKAAMKTAMAITKIAAVIMRLPNSIHRWISGSPLAPEATRLLAVHLGQSVQPSPDWLSRTAAPGGMMARDATTPASAIRRMATAEGLGRAPDACPARPLSDARHGARPVPAWTGPDTLG